MEKLPILLKMGALFFFQSYLNCTNKYLLKVLRGRRFLSSLDFFSHFVAEGRTVDLNILTLLCPGLFVLPFVLTSNPLPTTLLSDTTAFVWGLHLLEEPSTLALFLL